MRQSIGPGAIATLNDLQQSARDLMRQLDRLHAAARQVLGIDAEDDAEAPIMNKPDDVVADFMNGGATVQDLLEGLNIRVRGKKTDAGVVTSLSPEPVVANAASAIEVKTYDRP